MNEEMKALLIETHRALAKYRATLTNDDEQMNADEVLADIEEKFYRANIELKY